MRKKGGKKKCPSSIRVCSGKKTQDALDRTLREEERRRCLPSSTGGGGKKGVRRKEEFHPLCEEHFSPNRLSPHRVLKNASLRRKGDSAFVQEAKKELVWRGQKRRGRGRLSPPVP